MAPAKSDVWQHWDRVGNKNEKKAQCKICFKVYASSNGTSNLWKHLQQAHSINKPEAGNTSARTGTARSAEDDIDHANPDDPSPADEVQVQRNVSDEPAPSTSGISRHFEKRPRASASNSEQPRRQQQQHTLEETLQRSKSFQDGGSRSARIEDALLFMVMKDNLCLSTPEKLGFRHFCKETVPLWTPVSRKTLTLRMETKHEVLHNVVREAVAHIEAVSLTADCWTERHSNNSFLGVTVHFPVEDEMQSAVLGVTHLDQSHTGVYLSEKLKEFCEEWSIDLRKVTMIVTDNAENAKLSARLAFGEDRHITCFDHTLNLIPKAAISYKGDRKENSPFVPGAPELISKVKAIVTFSHSSNRFADELKRIQRERGKSEGTMLRLIQEVPTRWNSCYCMLQRFIDLSEIITIVSLKFPELQMVSSAELKTLRTLRDLLHPFYEATEEMSAEKVTTASKVIPMTHLIAKRLLEIDVPPPDGVARALKNFLLSELDRRFKDVEHKLPLAIATMLDPRFLKIYFDKPRAVVNTMSKVEDYVKAELRREAKEAENEQAAAAAAAAATATLEDDASSSSASLWSSHDAFIASTYTASVTDDLSGRAHTELRAFLGRSPAPRNANPLTVWETIKHEYPRLYKLARKYLTIIAASVPSERLFSLCGRVMDDDGNRLTPQHLSQRIFLATVDKDLWTSASFKKK